MASGAVAGALSRTMTAPFDRIRIVSAGTGVAIGGAVRIIRNGVPLRCRCSRGPAYAFARVGIENVYLVTLPLHCYGSARAARYTDHKAVCSARQMLITTRALCALVQHAHWASLTHVLVNCHDIPRSPACRACWQCPLSAAL